jgi:hypothetical protein
MKDIWAYGLKIIGDNFFCGTFINTKTSETQVCYVLDSEKHNTTILRHLINECMLIGYGNINYDDILLSYMWHNKTVDTKELSSLSYAIINGENWEDILFYKNRYVDSLDLMKILGHDHYGLCVKEENVLFSDVDAVLSLNLYEVQFTLELLDNLKKDLNYGFRSSYNTAPTQDSIHDNYLVKILEL